MRNLLLVLLVVGFLSGCFTLPVGNKQVSWKNDSPYAVIADSMAIDDESKRKDVLAATVAVSENNSLWGSGNGGGNYSGNPFVNGEAQTRLGSNRAVGFMQNTKTFPIKVFTEGLSGSRIFGPGEKIRVEVPHGEYRLAMYNAQTGILIGTETLRTDFRKVYLDEGEFDFFIDLDGL